MNDLEISGQAPHLWKEDQMFLLVPEKKKRGGILLVRKKKGGQYGREKM